jgi:hypothetical protein
VHSVPQADVSSQRVSDFLKILGNERLQRDFFTAYLSLPVNQSVGTLIDSTGLPNEIDFSLNAWGHHGSSSESETRLLYVVDRNTGMPVYRRSPFPHKTTFKQKMFKELILQYGNVKELEIIPLYYSTRQSIENI